jgi:hypothetical protein
MRTNAALKPISSASARTQHPRAEFSAARILLGSRSEDAMSLVRLLGFTTLGCGCVVGRYREVATSREVTYVEEKGKTCGSHGHRRNHTIAADRAASTFTLAAKAS